MYSRLSAQQKPRKTQRIAKQGDFRNYERNYALALQEKSPLMLS